MHFLYVGNFKPSHSTENHVANSLEANGHRVMRLQEDDPATWTHLATHARDYDATVCLWTRTWHLDYDAQRAGLRQLRVLGVPVVGYHLDRWWGLEREHQVSEEPFFTDTDLMVTADGGHDDLWAKAGVTHRWMPPAVFAEEARRSRTAQPSPRYASDLAFVGSWASYHPEWPWRKHLVDWLMTTYPGRCRLWPAGSQPAVRGDALAVLYRSVKVLVGDSCLAAGATRYWSDRIPETLGRAGFLVHPDVEGLDEHFKPGEHLATFPLGDFNALRATIDRYLAEPEERARIAQAGQEHVLAEHTYEVRMRQLVGLLAAEGYIDAP